MKKLITPILITFAIFSLSYNMYAGTTESEKHEFKSSDREVNFDVERGQGEVLIYIQSASLGTYDQIIVERSNGGSAGFTGIKTLDLADMKIKGDSFKTTDKFPLPAKGDSYYRIKIVAKDGSMKTFPPVLLEALTR